MGGGAENEIWHPDSHLHGRNPSVYPGVTPVRDNCLARTPATGGGIGLALLIKQPTVWNLKPNNAVSDCESLDSMFIFRNNNKKKRCNLL